MSRLSRLPRLLQTLGVMRLSVLRSQLLLVTKHSTQFKEGTNRWGWWWWTKGLAICWTSKCLFENQNQWGILLGWSQESMGWKLGESTCLERCFCCRTSSSQVSTQRVTVEPMVYKNPWEGEPIRFLCLIFSSWRWTGGCPRTWWKNDPRITCGCFRHHSQCPHIIPKHELSTCCHYYASFFGRIQLPLVHPGSKARALKPIGSIYSPGW